MAKEAKPKAEPKPKAPRKATKRAKPPKASSANADTRTEEALAAPRTAPPPAVAPSSPPPPTPARSPRSRDIGIDVPPPPGTCSEHHCPFHGSIRVRGQMLEGIVVSTGMRHSIIVERERLQYISKFERYEKRTRRIPAHAPPCLGLAVGNRVTLMECRPLSKTISFVAIHNRGAIA